MLPQNHRRERDTKESPNGLMRPAFTTLIMRERDFLETRLNFYYYLNGPKASTSLRAERVALYSFFGA